MPELVQHDFTADNVVARLNEILADGPARSKMIAGLAKSKPGSAAQPRRNGTPWIGPPRP